MAERDILVLARRNHTEAMRVASGLTIFDHRVRLVFLAKPLVETRENQEQIELLDLSDIVPETTVPEMADDLTLLDAAALAEIVAASDVVINL